MSQLHSLSLTLYRDWRRKRETIVKKQRQQLTLYRRATYQIKVPGRLDESWSDWIGEMTLMIEGEDDNLPVTTLTGILDQAALQGLLRRLYSMGLPLISAICLEHATDSDSGPCRQ